MRKVYAIYSLALLCPNLASARYVSNVCIMRKVYAIYSHQNGTHIAF